MDEPRLAFLTLRVPRPSSRRDLLHTFRMAADVIDAMFSAQHPVSPDAIVAAFQDLFNEEDSILVPFVYPDIVDAARRRTLWARCMATALIVMTTPPGDQLRLEPVEEVSDPPPPRRATQAQVNALPSAPFREFEEFEVCQRTGDERPTCSICLVKFRSNSRVKKLPCHHMFHKTCINAALMRCSLHCPLCRREVYI
jgi:hypothetical protein